MKILISRLRVVPVTIIMGTIFFLSHQPGTGHQFSLIPGFDKLAHAFIYAGLAAAAIFALPVRILRTKPFLIGTAVALFCLLYGAIDEYHQSFIPGRDPSIGDIAADTAGAVLVVLLWLRYSQYGPGKKLGRS